MQDSTSGPRDQDLSRGQTPSPPRAPRAYLLTNKLCVCFLSLKKKMTAELQTQLVDVLLKDNDSLTKALRTVTQEKAELCRAVSQLEKSLKHHVLRRGVCSVRAGPTWAGGRRQAAGSGCPGYCWGLAPRAPHGPPYVSVTCRRCTQTCAGARDPRHEIMFGTRSRQEMYLFDFYLIKMMETFLIV